MKKSLQSLAVVTAFLFTFLSLLLTGCSQEHITPSRSRVGYSAWHTQVSYTHCDPLPKTGKPEFVRGSWEMNDGILQHTACEEAPLAICNYVIESDHYTIWCTARKDNGPEGIHHCVQLRGSAALLPAELRHQRQHTACHRTD